MFAFRSKNDLKIFLRCFVNIIPDSFPKIGPNQNKISDIKRFDKLKNGFDIIGICYIGKLFNIFLSLFAFFLCLFICLFFLLSLCLFMFLRACVFSSLSRCLFLSILLYVYSICFVFLFQRLFSLFLPCV
jgi:hypothetical protein